MEGEQVAPNPASTKKPKFAPKIPQHRKAKATKTKVKSFETKDDLDNKVLLAKLNFVKSENAFGRRPPKVDTKSGLVEVAFGHGIKPSSFVNPRGSISKLEDYSGPLHKAPKEYVEPWDYATCYCPVSLPLRRPYSGNPEKLDEEEFGEDSSSGVNTVATPTAQELGLMDKSLEPQMLLFQFPKVLPLVKELHTVADKNADETKPDKSNSEKKIASRPGAAAAGIKRGDNKPADADGTSNRTCSLKDLNPGFLGKLLVYKSGKIKMKIGDALFNVDAGQNCVFAQDLSVINVKEKHCCVLGSLEKRAVVTPDADSLLEAIENL